MKSLIASIAVLTCLIFGSEVSAGLSSSGDLSIIGYNSDGGDGSIAFVIWKDIAASDSIDFWDHGLRTDGTFRTNEGAKTWTAASALDAGTVVTLDFDDDSASSGALASSGGSFILSTGGDQIFAGIRNSSTDVFDGSDNYNGTVLFGLHMNGNWDTNINDGNRSADPGNSFDNLELSSLGGERDNSRYTGLRDRDLTIEEYRAEILDSSNWETSDSIYDLDSTSFSFSAVPEPSAFTYALIFGLTIFGPRRRK